MLRVEIPQSPLGRDRMVDLLVNPFLCLNDEDIVLPGNKSPLERDRMVDLLVNFFLCLNDEDIVLPEQEVPYGEIGWLTSWSTSSCA